MITPAPGVASGAAGETILAASRAKCSIDRALSFRLRLRRRDYRENALRWTKFILPLLCASLASAVLFVSLAPAAPVSPISPVSPAAPAPPAAQSAPAHIDDGQRVKLRVIIPPSSATAPWDRAGRAVFEEYVRTHPEVEVIPAGGPLLEGGGATGNALLSIAGGISPDVFSLFYNAAQSYIQQGFVAPLDGYLETWEGAKAVPPQFWQVVTDRKDGKRYGAVYTWPTVYLVYRRDLFEEAGIDPDRPPRNWDELFDYAKRLSNPDMVVETALNPRAGFGRAGLYLQSNGTWIFANFAWQGGGDMVRQRSDGRWESAIDSPGTIRALEFYKRLRWEKWERGGKTYTGVARVGFADAAGEYAKVFGRGEAAMVVMPLRRLQNVLETNIVRPESIGLAALPAGPTGIRASIVDGDCYCISSRLVGDKRKMDAAWEYIRFMTSDRAKEIETKVFVELGFGKFIRDPYWLKKFGYDEYFNEIDPQHLAAFDEALKYGRPEPYCPGYEAIMVEMDVPASKVLRDPEADPATELRVAAKRINTFFFKLYPEDEMRYKRRVGLGIGIFFAALIAVASVLLVRSLARRVSSGVGGMAAVLKASRWKHVNAWFFLAPAVTTIFIWNYMPLIRGSRLSFYDYHIMSADTSAFVGLDNFIEAVGQPVFWSSLYNTFFYTSLTMTFGFVAPIFVALLLSEVPRWKITFRMLFYLPALTSGLVLMFLWKNLLFDATPAGALNQMLAFLRLPPQTWLQDPRLAMLCVVLPGVWAGAGPGSIIYLAALKTVPDELYEAAEMDGASPLRKITCVTLPYLKPLIIINFFGAFVGSFQATQNIIVMTMGGPERATHTLSLEIFFNAFLYLKLGYATAMSWIMGSMLVGFTLYQLRIFQRVQFTTGASTEKKSR